LRFLRKLRFQTTFWSTAGTRIERLNQSSDRWQPAPEFMRQTARLRQPVPSPCGRGLGRGQ
ncbi:TPA: hypothetical protein ACFM68_002242, partial [Neisseria meningitidis]